MVRTLLFVLSLVSLITVIVVQHVELERYKSLATTQYAPSSSTSVNQSDINISEKGPEIRQSTKISFSENSAESAQVCNEVTARQLDKRINEQFQQKYRALLQKFSYEFSEDTLIKVKQELSREIVEEIIFGGERAGESIDSELHDLLGDENYNLLRGFQKFGDETHTFLDTFTNRLEQRDLSDLEPYQRDELTLLLVNAKSNGLENIYGSIDQSIKDEALIKGYNLDNFLGTEASLVARQELFVNRIMDQARNILNEEQFRRFVAQPE